MESQIAYMGDAQFDEWVATLEALSSWTGELDLPGHGAPFWREVARHRISGILSDLVTQGRSAEGCRASTAGRNRASWST